MIELKKSLTIDLSGGDLQMFMEIIEQAIKSFEQLRGTAHNPQVYDSIIDLARRIYGYR